jgi:hypothetical protein
MMSGVQREMLAIAELELAQWAARGGVEQPSRTGQSPRTA